MESDVDSVTEYIAAQPQAVQPVLERLRSVIRKAVPGAEEVISYKMPTYKIGGRVILHIAAWKNHVSLYPCTEPLIAAFRKELEPYELNHKGTVRFPLSKPIPVKLIERIAKFRAKEVVERDTTLPRHVSKS
jgi:uncharacterized protein YdhG (YjbR/CyaY superfamily)